MPSETDYAWAAGIIDGEGSIIMTICRPGIGRRTTVSFQVRISVRMTHRETIERLHKIFGGTFSICKARDPLKHKDAYAWYVGDLKTIEVISLVKPYLVTKLAQAEVVLNFRSNCYPEYKPSRGLECSPALVDLRQTYYRQLAALNRKGPIPLRESEITGRINSLTQHRELANSEAYD